jgi:aspartyl-tRNA(Asn)/glutamyl-tRNA(Gln) amidotransferase subunit A
MPSKPIYYRDVTDTAATLAAGELSSHELTAAYLDRIDRIDRTDGRLNAYITVTLDDALAAATSAICNHGSGERGATY